MTAHTQPRPTQNDYPNGVLPFLPMLYVAWADAELEATEFQLIQTHIEQQNWLHPAEKAQILAWLDQDNPPSIRLMKQWLGMIRESVGQLSAESRTSLADLGKQIARQNDDNRRCASDEACQALDQIEAALGVISHETAREMLANAQPFRPITEIEKPAFNIAALTDLLDGKDKPLRQKMRALLTQPEFSYKTFENKDNYRDHVLYWTQLLADEGIGRLSYPQAVGGADNISDYLIAMEMMAYHDLSLLIKFGVQFGLFGGSIVKLGTAKHHQKYLRDVGSLALPGCFAMTELGHGSNVRELETTVIFDRETDEFVIHTPNERARKEYIGNAARHGHLATVFAQLIIDGESYGINAFLVPIRNQNGQVLSGVKIEDNGLKMGLNGVDNGRLWFEHVRIPRENMLDRFAQVTADGEYVSEITSESRRFFTMIGTLVGGRIGIALSALSSAKSGLTIAIRYANRRRQFGRTGEPETLLIDYPTHQRRLIPLLANAYALDFALKHLLNRYATADEKEMREVETLAAALKAYSTWNTTKTLQEGREATGGQGYMTRNRFATLKADTDIFTTFEGDNVVLMQLAAKGRLTAFQRQLQDLKWHGIARFLVQQAAHEVVGHNPVVARQTSSDHLRDPEFHLAAFRHREDQLVTSTANTLRKLIKGGTDSHDAMLAVQNDLLRTAQAYVERVILEQFLAGIAGVEDGALATQLQQLATIFALTHIENDAAWFLEHGTISGAKSSAIRKEIDVLLHDMRYQALHLVNAFGIPDELLAAPIGAQ